MSVETCPLLFLATLKIWCNDLVSSLEFERMRYVRNDELRLFKAIWIPLIMQLEKTNHKTQKVLFGFSLSM